MEIAKAVVLGIVQGTTEFIPISSSGHLVLVPWLLGWENPGLAFDAIVHWGTLLAVLAFFAQDIRCILVAMWRDLLTGTPWATSEARLGWFIALGTVPAALAGLLLESTFEQLFGRPVWVAGFLLVTGLLLVVSERLHTRSRGLESLTVVDALLIGTAQALAITPGISRSGATIAAGLVRHLDRPAAARYSFLLMIPAVFGAGLLQTVDLWRAGVNGDVLISVVAGFVAAAVSGYLSIGFLLRYLQRASLHLFACWCWAFGLLCLIVAWWRG